MNEHTRARWAMLASLLIVMAGCSEEVTPPAEAAPPAPEPENERPAPPFDAGARFIDAGTEIDAGTDAGTEADAGTPTPVDGGVVLTGAGLVYGPDRTQSPIDSSVVQNLKAIAARGTGRPGVFARVGDSVSIGFTGVAGGDFLNCFDGIIEGTVSWDVNIRLGGRNELAPTVDFFRATRLPLDASSFTRISLVTRVAQTASWPLTGTPTFLDRELTAINPRYAVVLYGSNDILYGAPTAYPLADQAERYEKHMRALTDTLTSKGVIPLLTTMPLRTSPPRYLGYAPVFAGVVRAIAQGRQVPLIDYQRELRALGAPYGLRTDGTHPSYQNYNTACWFDPASLSRYGANVRNLITLQSLDRMRQVFEAGASSLDLNAPRVTGDGSLNAPVLIDQVPWGELRDLKASGAASSGTLSCAGSPGVAGPQVLYKLVLTRPMSVRVLALNGGAGGQQLSLLSSPSLSSCLKTDARLVTGPLTAGTYYVAVSALTGAEGGEYNLSVTECTPGDPDC